MTDRKREELLKTRTSSKSYGATATWGFPLEIQLLSGTGCTKIAIKEAASALLAALGSLGRRTRDLQGSLPAHLSCDPMMVRTAVFSYDFSAVGCFNFIRKKRTFLSAATSISKGCKVTRKSEGISPLWYRQSLKPESGQVHMHCSRVLHHGLGTLPTPHTDICVEQCSSSTGAQIHIVLI